ncbi:MAG: SusD/RagB family nutrient-binding outer membrane lipoprotein [Chitinophagaceae bacterium]
MKFSKILIAAALVGTVSCTKYDFGDYNNNPAPDRTQNPQTSSLLTNAIWGSVRGLTLTDFNSDLYAQYLSEIQYPGVSLYQNPQSDWSGYYAGPLEDYQTIINLNTSTPSASNVAGNGDNASQIAIAKIMKAYLFAQVTDRWGDVPFSQALSSTNRTPQYDAQATIYQGIINMLKEGVNGFGNGAAVKGDILFNGDASKWKKFANSLRMILAMRAVKADQNFAKTEFLSAYNDAAGHITTNADNPNFTFPGGGFNNPYYDNFSTRTDYAVSKTFVDIVQGVSSSDPRLPNMITKPGANFKGAPYGWERASITAWLSSNQDYGVPSARITAINATLPLITAAEVLFVQAEAAAYGWIPANNAADYYNAITQSMGRWGVTNQAAINTYLADPNVSIGTSYGTGALAKIYTQKYIDLFMNGPEAWFEW